MTLEIKDIGTLEDYFAVYQLADTYREQEQWQEAEMALKRSVELKPDFFWSWHNLGDVQSKLKRWQEAAMAYGEAVKLDPQFFWSWHNLGDVQSKLKRWQEAAMAYGEAVKLDPQFFWSWHNLGDAHSNLQHWSEAISAYLHGIYLQPENDLCAQKLGNALKQNGTLEETIHYCRQLIQDPPPNSVFELLSTQPQKLIDIADILIKQHQILGAIVICYLILEIQPTQTNVLLHLAQLFKQQSQLENTIASNRHKLEQHTASSLLTQLTISSPPPSSAQPIEGEIVIKTNGKISLQQLNDLCLAVGWSNRPLDRLEQALKGSFRYLTAWHIYQGQKRLIAFGRAVSDGVYQATLLDIVVHPDFQDRGVGKTMVNTLTRQLKAAKITDISLFASHHKADFYHKLGFVSQPNNLQWMLWSHADGILNLN